MNALEKCGLSKSFLDLEQDACLPVIQLGDPVKLDHCSSVAFLVAGLDSLEQSNSKLVFPSPAEGVVFANVGLGTAASRDCVLGMI